ncbi:MAG: hypothetical protein R8G33_08240 [Gammaproteobacteria bacterium]|nr:hypothetical protein [Gammaproteobacteria bacterium]
MKVILIFSLCLASWLSTVFANDADAPVTRSVDLVSSNDFTILNGEVSTLTIRPLKEKLRSIENLRDTQAVGISYLGNLTLSESATPLSALRELSVQISSGLDIDLALITDSNTSQSLQPHEMLLLYHPQLVITLALTKVESSNEYTLIGTYAIPVDNTQPIIAVEEE